MNAILPLWPETGNIRLRSLSVEPFNSGADKRHSVRLPIQPGLPLTLCWIDAFDLKPNVDSDPVGITLIRGLADHQGQDRVPDSSECEMLKMWISRPHFSADGYFASGLGLHTWYQGWLTIVPIVPWHGPPSPGPRSGWILVSALVYGIKLFACCELMQRVLQSSLYTMRKCTECVIYSNFMMIWSNISVL